MGWNGALDQLDAAPAACLEAEEDRHRQQREVRDEPEGRAHVDQPRYFTE